MKTTIIVAVVFGALAGLGGRMALRGGPVTPEYAAPSPDALAYVQANGLVEGARPEAALRPETAGVLAAVNVRENAEVSRGAVLAEIANETQKHQVELTRAELAIARQTLERLVNGERAEKREEAAKEQEAMRIRYEQATKEHERAARAHMATSDQERETARFRMHQAKAEWEAAQAKRKLVDAPPRAEDKAIAEAQVRAAEARLKLAEADLAKTQLRAPAGGRVLQVFAEPGEAASPTSPQPVLILADLSKRRVRAFVEELDMDRIEVGRTAEVTAIGIPDKTFLGKVAVVLPRMGKRAPESDAPGEYKDIHFREVLVDLDGAYELPTNLRVDVRIRVGGGAP